MGQRYSRSLRHNSREFPIGCSWNTNSPEGGRGGPGGLVLHQTRAENGPRGLVLHQGGWDRGDPRGDDRLNTNGC